MFRRFLPLLAFTCLCHADEAKRPTAEWAEELSTTFAKHSGYIARYEGRSGESQVKVTLGANRAGQGLMQMTYTEEDQQKTMRMWMDGDLLHIDAGMPGGRRSCKGFRDFLEKTVDMINEFSLVPGRVIPCYFETHLYLTKTDLVCFGGITAANRPPWFNWAKDATMAEEGEDEVVFREDGGGEMTISRKSGMMTRQLLAGEDGRTPELVLTDLELNPDADAFAKLRDGWSNEGAQDIDIASIIQARHVIVFQNMIRQVEFEEVPLERLNEVLQAKADYLRAFFRPHVPGSDKLDPKNHTTWKKYLDYAKWEMSEKLKAEAGDKTQLEAKLATPEVKAAIRDSLARELAEDRREMLPGLLSKDYLNYFGATTDRGREAVKAIEEAVIFAYSAAEVECRMEEIQ